jgi:phosphoserine/homoserine phosphotransferase
VKQFPQFPVNRNYVELKASIDGAAARLLRQAAQG